MLRHFWPEMLVGGIMILIGLLTILWWVPNRIFLFANEEKKEKLLLPRFSDHANKSGFMLVAIGALILFLVMAWHVAWEVGLIPR